MNALSTSCSSATASLSVGSGLTSLIPQTATNTFQPASKLAPVLANTTALIATAISGTVGGVWYAVQPPWLAVDQDVPSRVQWDVESISQHPTMKSAEVRKFQRAMLGVDMQALQSIFEIAKAHFRDVPGLTWSYEMALDSDTLEPQLFLQFDTHGMDIDEQIRRETQMQGAFLANDRLSKAKKYNPVTVV